MSLIHGQEITAQHIEDEVSRWSAGRFARMCNALAWARAWRGASATPAFTERVNVSDDGVDADWLRDLGSDAALEDTPFLKVGFNVFQYKKRAVAPATRNAVVANLRSNLAGAALQVEQRVNQAISCYVLWVNIDLVARQKAELKEAILNGVEHPASVAVIGAAELAAMFNDLPHLRSAFFSTAAFRTWGDSWDAHRRSIAFAETSLIGRDAELAAVRGWIDDPAVLVVAVSGPPAMGKSRLILEATRHRDVDVVEQLDPTAATVEDLRRLETPDRVAIVLIQDPEPGVAGRLTLDVLARDRMKLLMTLPTEQGMPAPSFGLDTRVKHLGLEPIDDDASRNLLAAAGAALDYSLESWVVDKAGGIPGVLLAAASVGRALRREAGSFIEQVGAQFERRARNLLDQTDLAALGLISLLSHLRIEGDDGAQVGLVCERFGMDPNALLNAVDRLEALGFARRAGSFVEAAPPILANRLAGRAIRGRTTTLLDLFAALDVSGQVRLLRRMVQVGGAEAETFWGALFGGDGLFGSLESILDNSKLFRLSAPAAGNRASRALLSELKELSVDERKQIEGDRRRNLVGALEDMLSMPETSEHALRCLGLLAEAENETWGNNATGVFKAAFYPLHSQTPLPLARRLAALEDLIARHASDAAGVLAVDAAAAALDGHGFMVLRRSYGLSPLGSMPAMTWGEVWDYQDRVLALLETAAFDDERAAMRSRAAGALPRAAAEFAVRGRPYRAVLRFNRIVDTIISRSGASDFNVNEVADRMGWCRYALRDLPAEQRPNDAIAALDALLERFRTAEYGIRLRLWLGGWTHIWDAPQASGKAAWEIGNQMVAELTQEACSSPEKLSQDLVSWLFSQEAQRSHQFWVQIGRCDGAGHYADAARSFSKRQDRAFAFLAYLHGWSLRDRAAARAFFEEAQADPEIHPTVRLNGVIAFVDANDGAVRIAASIADGTLDAAAAAKAIADPNWVKDVSPDAFEAVLQSIVGADFERAGLSIEPIWWWFHQHSSDDFEASLTELLWRCLGAPLRLRDHLADYYADEVAGLMAQRDPERGFALLEAILLAGRIGDAWDPIAKHGRKRFWTLLRGHDRNWALTAVLDAMVRGDGTNSRLAWQLPDLIELPMDADFLAEYAVRCEAEAEAVCDAITGRREGFWPIALRIVETYPTNGRLRSKLTTRVEQMGQVITGPYSEHIDRCLADIESARPLAVSFPHARAWLEQMAERFRCAAAAERRREADEGVD